MAEILIGSIKKGEAGGVAELDASGRVPSTQLPSYVDDVLEFANLAAFPAPGETGKIYIATDTNKTYRWSGAGYAEISALLKRQADTLYANALIGNAQGGIVQVEDAWEADAVVLTVPGKSVQDGTPTPDAPVEVDVVDSPVRITATGKNLVGSSESDVEYNVHGTFSFAANAITCIPNQSWAGAYVRFNDIIKASGETFFMSYDSTVPNISILVQCLDKDFNVIDSDKIDLFRSYNTVYDAQYSAVLTPIEFSVPDDVPFIKVGLAFTGQQDQSVTVSNIQLERGTSRTAYEPYESTQQTITLPTDHNYLASLPDGTRDELVLRSDGVAVLVTRTAKIASYAGENVTTLFMSTTGAMAAGAMVIYGAPLTTKYSADNGTTWSTTDPAAGQSAIPMHKGTNNVWCTDRLSPEVALDYVQDTNKVINELRAADICVGYDGTIYSTAGDDVRGQVQLLHDHEMIIGEKRSLDFVMTHYINSAGHWAASPAGSSGFGCAVVDVSDVNTLVIDMTYRNQYIKHVGFSRSEPFVVGTSVISSSIAFNEKGTHYVEVPEGARYAVIMRQVDTSGNDKGSPNVYACYTYDDLHEEIDEIKDALVAEIPLTWENGTPKKYVDSSGLWGVWSDASVDFQIMSDPIQVKKGLKFVIGNFNTAANPYLARVAFFDRFDIENELPISCVYYHSGDPVSVEIEVPEGATYMSVAKNVSMGSEVRIDPEVLFGVDAEIIYSISSRPENSSGAIASINVPEKYSLVVGDTFELFWKGIIEAVDPYAFNIHANCSVGKCFKRKFEFTPTTAGTYPLTVSIEDNSGNVIDSKTVNLVVSNVANSPSTLKNVLCVGDSLLANGQWAYEADRRLTGTGGTPNGNELNNAEFIGTNDKEGTGYEGYGGWTFTSYNTANVRNDFVWITCTHDKTSADQHSIYQDSNGAKWKIETIEAGRIKMIRTSGSSAMPSSGSLAWVSGGVNHSNIAFTASAIASGNPFWDESSNKVDFAAYASRLGVSSIDFCYVLLGWNSTTTTSYLYKTSVKTFIDNLLSDFPDCEVALLGLQIPSLDGFGVSYGCEWNYYDKMKKVFEFNDLYAEIASEYDNVHFVNIAGQFDTENNMPSATRNVNVRSSKTETYQTNGVHPATEGYNQIADAVYRDLTHELNA